MADRQYPMTSSAAAGVSCHFFEFFHSDSGGFNRALDYILCTDTTAERSLGPLCERHRVIRRKIPSQQQAYAFLNFQKLLSGRISLKLKIKSYRGLLAGSVGFVRNSKTNNRRGHRGKEKCG